MSLLDKRCCDVVDNCTNSQTVREFIHDYPTDTYIWENDWDEGQQDVYILGFVKVEDIDIPGFKSGVMVYKEE